MLKTFGTFLPALCAALGLVSAGCGQSPQAKTGFPDVKQAVAVVEPVGTSTVHGIVTFTQTGGELRVIAKIHGLKPNTVHGFHIHEYGDISDVANKSVGGHYNPESYAHGGPETMPHHAGDLGNITADAKGDADYEIAVEDITIAGSKDPILGRSVVIHSDVDDMKTQPSGNSGTMIAAGVIGVGKATTAKMEAGDEKK